MSVPARYAVAGDAVSCPELTVFQARQGGSAEKVMAIILPCDPLQLDSGYR